jgi:hypothetical protein
MLSLTVFQTVKLQQEMLAFYAAGDVGQQLPRAGFRAVLNPVLALRISEAFQRNRMVWHFRVYSTRSGRRPLFSFTIKYADLTNTGLNRSLNVINFLKFSFLFYFRSNIYPGIIIHRSRLNLF